MPFWRKEHITPAQIIILGFLTLILAGTGLLMLPFATNGEGGATFADALFTSTSATCVTGLVLHDTALYWSPFGQAVILLLIEIGGMGVVTMAVAISIFTGKKIGLKQRWIMQESISAPQVGGIVRQTRFILMAALLIQAAGALLLAFRFWPQFGFLQGTWYAVFHSISAFCNAGFDLMGSSDAPFASLTAYTGDFLVSGTVSLLIILGGIGFLTWHDVYEHRLHIQYYRLQSRLILATTLALLAGGFLFFFAYEFQLPQWADLTVSERLQASMFQAVTPRTAGFNTVDLGNMSSIGQLLTILLMLTGGSPGSTAGGFKTTTLIVLILSCCAVFRQRSCAQCFGRRIPEDTLRRAAAILLLYLFLFLTGGILISCIDGVSLKAALFEASSAIGTVGLSLGITSKLSSLSRLILILLMYFGRVGGLTMIYALTFNVVPGRSQFPQERVTVG